MCVDIIGWVHMQGILQYAMLCATVSVGLVSFPYTLHTYITHNRSSGLQVLVCHQEQWGAAVEQQQSKHAEAWSTHVKAWSTRFGRGQRQRGALSA